MISLGFNLAAGLGLLSIVMGIVYLPLMRSVSNSSRSSNLGIYNNQAVIVSLLLFLAGMILFFQGWRLDPILQLGYVLLIVQVTFLMVKDILLSSTGID